MQLRARFSKKTFRFKFDARTSRGAMKEKLSWFIFVYDDNRPVTQGVGECGPLPGLSIDDVPGLESVLTDVTQKVSEIRFLRSEEDVYRSVKAIVPLQYPSVIFALETALLDLLHGGQRMIFDNGFVKGQPLPINGLVWMGDDNFMREQVDDKIQQGYSCIKLKVGGLNFEKECAILQDIRKKYSKDQITIRVDANGAFAANEAMDKLKALAAYDIHSIEQPIKPGEHYMRTLCQESPIPIALDEELIGQEHNMSGLLIDIMPHYIILKPTLHGGLSGCEEWILVAEKLNIGWWITSALESNIGLNAICQFTANYPVTLPQGLGTGALYDNNFRSPLVVENGTIRWGSGDGWGEHLFD